MKHTFNTENYSRIILKRAVCVVSSWKVKSICVTVVLPAPCLIFSKRFLSGSYSPHIWIENELRQSKWAESLWKLAGKVLLSRIRFLGTHTRTTRNSMVPRNTVRERRSSEFEIWSLTLRAQNRDASWQNVEKNTGLPECNILIQWSLRRLICVWN
jgi:hypothetical protein